MRISVIVPVLNDDAALDALLARLRRISPSVEVIVADGGRSGGAREICGRNDAVWLPCAPGRGPQMNRGAAASSGDVLWFLHADSVIHPDSFDGIARALDDPETAGGAFRFRLLERHGYAPLLDLGVGLRCRWLRLPYGDQGLFVRRRVFEAMGGYREISFLEDLDFVRRLRRIGRVEILSTPIGVSSRRWEREGFARVTMRNWLVTLAFALGVPPDRLVGWYRPEETAVGTTRGIPEYSPWKRSA
jgi:rSAM/selenodomain-associated transferase 2